MKLFELGNIYMDSNKKEYRVISRTNKSVTFEDVEKPGNSLYQFRKSLQNTESGNEYVILKKETEALYRNHKKSVGRYQLRSGKVGNKIYA